MLQVATIELSDKVCITDPCYKRGTWCGFYDQKITPWLYNCYVNKFKVKDWWERVAVIEIIHESIHRDELTWVWNGSAWVDSWQMGMFCDTLYPKEQDDAFYQDCCDATLSSFQWGTINNKWFVSSSGFGDGTYAVKVGIENETGRILGVSIDFGVL